MQRYLIYKGEDTGLFDLKGDASDSVRSSTSVGPIPGVTEDDEEKKAKAPLRNQFNFSERAAQTVNNSSRVYIHKIHQIILIKNRNAPLIQILLLVVHLVIV